MESNIKMSLIQTNIKNMLLFAAMDVNQYVSMISLVSFFKSYLGEDVVYNFINSMIEESKYCTDIRKKDFNRELVMTKMIMKILKTLRSVGFVIMFMLMVILKQEIIVISVEDKEVLQIEIVMPKLY